MALAVPGETASAQPAPPKLETNEADIAALSRAPAFAIGDIPAVFAYVMSQLPERVNVYPTENYYYFRFQHGGVPYGGNIRLAAIDRDKGLLHFAYGEDVTDWNLDPDERYMALGQEQGVAVERVEPLVYRVSHGGKSVTFALNDLSKVKPPADLVRADETYLGPVFDESGVRFFLVFNARLKVFHYLLDETAGPSDVFFSPLEGTPIRIGKRTGFAFYRHEGRDILIGVGERQSMLNTYYDGPFDQLPENFIEGEALREAIVAADPKMKGRIDRLGHFPDGASRYLIHPYMTYRQSPDLAVFHRCATAKRVVPAQRPACFVISEAEARRPNPQPLPFARR
ncbi:MAG: hypothetical protein FJX62_21840 [Alphaproteobacteria bacterium]|nr:hypothetical protein [Alphaproteobacteria bacterium]